MVDPQDIGVYAVGGTGVLAAVAFLGRKIWQNLTSATVDSAKNAADAAVFTQMRQQLADLAAEIRELKAEHRLEKEELEKRITSLEDKIQKLGLHIGKIRRLALEAYTSLSMVKDCEGCKPIEDALRTIKVILDDA